MIGQFGVGFYSAKHSVNLFSVGTGRQGHRYRLLSVHRGTALPAGAFLRTWQLCLGSLNNWVDHAVEPFRRMASLLFHAVEALLLLSTEQKRSSLDSGALYNLTLTDTKNYQPKCRTML